MLCIVSEKVIFYKSKPVVISVQRIVVILNWFIRKLFLAHLSNYE